LHSFPTRRSSDLIAYRYLLQTALFAVRIFVTELDRGHLAAVARRRPLFHRLVFQRIYIARISTFHPYGHNFIKCRDRMAYAHITAEPLIVVEVFLLQQPVLVTQ